MWQSPKHEMGNFKVYTTFNKSLGQTALLENALKLNFGAH